MAKSSKKSKATAPGEVPSAAPGSEVENGAAPAASVSRTVAARANSGRKRPGASTRKAATGGKPRKKLTATKPVPTEVAISDDAIRLRAYFIAEWRMQNGLAGDSESDWLEARRQLAVEAADRA